MTMDGLLLYKICMNLQKICPGKIGKIQNISDEEIQFHIHSRGFGNQKLIVNVHSNTNRIYLNSALSTTQAAPTNFVMVLRKLCSQGIITEIKQINFDRILRVTIHGHNEFGDSKTYFIYFELMGKYANIVLVDQNEIIVDALKRIPIYENSKRFIHPGAKYILPVQDCKKNPFDCKDIDLNTSLVKQIHGFSPMLSKEFIYRIKNGQEYNEILNELLTSNSLYLYPSGYHCIELKHLNETSEKFELMDGLAHLFQKDEQKIRIKQQCNDVLRVVESEKKKNIKKLPKLEQSLENSYNYQIYQEYGDLLFAYMYNLEKKPIIEVPSFTTGELVTIPIDMRYDLKTNAKNFYKKYHKMKRSLNILEEQIKQCKEEIEYYNQLDEQLKHATVLDAMEIREELIQQKILRPRKIQNKKKKKKPNILQLEIDGIMIYIGKNNIQNSYITHQLSRKNDYWFHVKDYHGSHVLLKTDSPNEKLIRICANLAAFFSKGKNSSSVPVDYCPISQIKKVPGSKIGFVTMKSYKTIYIDPNQEEIEKIIQEYQSR